MKIRSRYLYYVITLVFVMYSANPSIFERKAFFNEILTLIGVLLIIKFINVGRRDFIHRFYFSLLFIGIIHSIVSLYFKDGTYVYLRHLVVVYSMMVFFLGPAVYSALFVNTFLSKTLGLIALLPLHAMSILPMSIIGLGALGVNRKRIVYLIPPLYIAIYLAFGYLLPIAVLFLVLPIVLLSTRYVFIYYFVVAFISLSLLLYVYEPYLDFMGADIGYVMEKYPVLAIDGNATVRLLMWAHIVYEVLPNNILGLGFGVPLFDMNNILSLYLVSAAQSDPYIEYTLSAHNSFAYLLARYGVVSIPIFSYFYFYIIYDFKKRESVGKTSYEEYVCFLSFMVVSVGAAFNVVLESPMHAGMYWGLLGMYQYARLNSLRDACRDE